MPYYLIDLEDPDGDLKGWSEVVLAPTPQWAVEALTQKPAVMTAGDVVMPDDRDSWRAKVFELRGQPPRLTSDLLACGVWVYTNVGGVVEIQPEAT